MAKLARVTGLVEQRVKDMEVAARKVGAIEKVLRPAGDAPASAAKATP